MFLSYWHHNSILCHVAWFGFSITYVCICGTQSDDWINPVKIDILTYYIFQTNTPNPSRQVAEHVSQVLLHHLAEEVRLSQTVDGDQQRQLRLGLQFHVTLGHWKSPGVITCSIGLCFDTTNINTSKHLLQTLNHHIDKKEFCNQYKLTFLWLKKKIWMF